MVGRQRAMRDEQKQERRLVILATAWQLFAVTEYSAITMAGVAEGAGLAKGTLYLYFQTKEELFLALLEAQFGYWFTELGAALGELRGCADAARVAAAIANSLGVRPGLPRLLALLHGVLEQNVTMARAASFKQMLLAGVAGLAEKLTSCLPDLGQARSVQALLHIYALIIGLQAQAEPAPAARAAMEQHPELGLFAINFVAELQASVTSLLRGMGNLEAL